MNHFGTLSALQPLLASCEVVMHRCRRRFDDEFLYYLSNVDKESNSVGQPFKARRRGYTLAEILYGLYLRAEYPVAQNAYALLTQLESRDDGEGLVSGFVNTFEPNNKPTDTF